MVVNLRDLRGTLFRASEDLHVFEEAGAVAAGDVTAVQNRVHTRDRVVSEVLVTLDVAANAALTFQLRSAATVLATITVPEDETEYSVPAATLRGLTLAARESLNINVTADGGAAEGIRVEAVTRSK